MEKELVCDLFDESAPENESLARLVDDGLWQELISKAERLEPPKALDEDRVAMDESQRKEPSAGQEEDAADPLAALVQELIEGP